MTDRTYGEMIGRAILVEPSLYANAPKAFDKLYASWGSYNFLWAGDDVAFPELDAKMLESFNVIDEDLLFEIIGGSDATGVMWPICHIYDYHAVGPRVDVEFPYPTEYGGLVAADAISK